jgi:hypothetical protein
VLGIPDGSLAAIYASHVRIKLPLLLSLSLSFCTPLSPPLPPAPAPPPSPSSRRPPSLRDPDSSKAPNMHNQCFTTHWIPHKSLKPPQVLQSFHYRLDDEVQQTLRSWYRLLEPGGKLYLSVPDFPTLCWLYLNPSNNMNGRFRILQNMMGSQDGKHQVESRS